MSNFQLIIMFVLAFTLVEMSQAAAQIYTPPGTTTTIWDPHGPKPLTTCTNVGGVISCI